MSELTITEALAELKTLTKRIEKKREFIGGYVARQDGVKDPLAKEVTGGSPVAIKRELQAVSDLEERAVELRRRIRLANERTEITVEGQTRTMADWLAWRRDVVPTRKQFLARLRAVLTQVHDKAKREGVPIRGQAEEAKAPTDYVINIDEMALATETEQMENILGQLDGRLSLMNATISI